MWCRSFVVVRALLLTRVEKTLLNASAWTHPTQCCVEYSTARTSDRPRDHPKAFIETTETSLKIYIEFSVNTFLMVHRLSRYSTANERTRCNFIFFSLAAETHLLAVFRLLSNIQALLGVMRWRWDSWLLCANCDYTLQYLLSGWWIFSEQHGYDCKGKGAQDMMETRSDKITTSVLVFSYISHESLLQRFQLPRYFVTH